MKSYQNPELTWIKFDLTDILTASGDGGTVDGGVIGGEGGRGDSELPIRPN